MRQLAEFLRESHLQWEMTQRPGLLQSLDARVKVLFLLVFVVIASIKKTLLPELAISGLVLLLALASRLDLGYFYKRILFFGCCFGFLFGLPACLNLITPGRMVLPLFNFAQPHQWWIYHLPAEVGITHEGLRSLALLSARVTTSISLSLLVAFTTPFPAFIGALRGLRVPGPFLLVMTLSYQYLYVFLRTLEDLYLAQKSRTVEVNPAQGRAWVAGRMAFLFKKSQHRYGEIFKAMLARGFSGELVFSVPGKLRRRDWLWGLSLLGTGLLVLAL